MFCIDYVFLICLKSQRCSGSCNCLSDDVIEHVVITVGELLVVKSVPDSFVHHFEAIHANCLNIEGRSDISSSEEARGFSSSGEAIGVGFVATNKAWQVLVERMVHHESPDVVNCHVIVLFEQIFLRFTQGGGGADCHASKNDGEHNRGAGELHLVKV